MSTLGVGHMQGTVTEGAGKENDGRSASCEGANSKEKALQGSNKNKNNKIMMIIIMLLPRCYY